METKKLFIILFVVASLSFSRLVGRYAIFFYEFMFNQKSKWYDKSIEKPRLLFHILAVIFFIISLIPLWNYRGINFANCLDCLNLASTLLSFSTGLFFALFSWTPKFKYKFIPKIESTIQKQNTLKIRKELDKETLLGKYLTEEYISKESFDDFERFIQGKEIENLIIWKNKARRSKQTTYLSLFDLLHEIIEGGFDPKNKERSIFVEYVKEIFVIEGVQFKKNINARYSEWITAMNKAEKK